MEKEKFERKHFYGRRTVIKDTGIYGPREEDNQLRELEGGAGKVCQYYFIQQWLCIVGVNYLVES